MGMKNNVFNQIFWTHPYRKTLVYHLGGEAGFYSEFNNMVLAILYCYKHNINFTLYSDNANFSVGGWSEYFISFCKETHDKSHSKYNFRQPYFVPVGIVFRIKSLLFRIKSGFDFYTYDLWDNFHNSQFDKEFFTIENKRYSCKDACRFIVNAIYRYNQKTSIAVTEIISKLKLPEKYVSVHIRRGDKYLEAPIEIIDRYIAFINERSCKDVFVSTDDYSVIEILTSLNVYKIYTLTTPDDKGYCQSDFVAANKEYKKQQLYKLFASIELMCRSCHLICSFSSNIGMFCGMRMDEDRIIGIDNARWKIW